MPNPPERTKMTVRSNVSRSFVSPSAEYRGLYAGMKAHRSRVPGTTKYDGVDGPISCLGTEDSAQVKKNPNTLFATQNQTLPYQTPVDRVPVLDCSEQ
jgi:hypothetical protein